MPSYLAFVLSNLRWLLGGFLLTFFSSFGQTFFISLAGGEIRSEYQLSHGEFAGLYMLATLASAATLPTVGKLVDVTSTSRTILIIVPMLALATASMAYSQSIVMLVLTLYLLRLFGQGMMSHTAMTAMGRWYAGHRGRAVSLVTLGHQFGEAILPLMMVALFATIGWRNSWFLSAGVLLAAALPVLYLLMSVEREPQRVAGAAKHTNQKQWRREQVLRDALFWRLITAVLAPSFIGTAIFFHQDYLVTLRGWPNQSFAEAFVVMAAVTVCSSLLTGQLIDRFSSVSLLPFFLLPLALGCLVIWAVEEVFGIYLFMALLGGSYGMTSVLYGALWPELYGNRHLGSVRASITALMVLSSAMGPGITGWLIDAGVPYTLQILILGGYCVIACTMMVPLRRRIRLRQRADIANQT